MNWDGCPKQAALRLIQDYEPVVEILGHPQLDREGRMLLGELLGLQRKIRWAFEVISNAGQAQGCFVARQLFFELSDRQRRE
jgi:hypothetical protein